MPRPPEHLEHTLAAWVRRVGTDQYYFVREVFPADTPVEHAHRRNCRLLVLKGYLEPERTGDVAPRKGALSMDQLMSRRFRPTL